MNNSYAVAVGLMTAAISSHTQAQSNAELYQMLKQQQAIIEQQSKAIEALQQQLNKQDGKILESAVAIEATTELVEAVMVADSTPKSRWDRLSIGGYGELHYNNLDGSGGASDKNEIDVHRFVTYFGYEFSDNVRFFSEIELEHSLAGDGKPGEVELEQAYIDWDLSSSTTWRNGLFLLPVGILNSTHEPDTFYGVERNNVEKNIIPTTWWEGGSGIISKFDSGVTFQGYIHSGLDMPGGGDYRPRAGRQKVAKADASDLATTLSLSWAGLPGVTIAGAFQYQEDITQGNDPTAGSATFAEVHSAFQRGDFTLRALYSQWNLNGHGPEAVGADWQYGWYVEPSYKVTDHVGIYARYEAWDNTANATVSSLNTQTSFGLNYWIVPQVVLKADYQLQDNDSGKELQGFNLGVGFSY